VVQLSQLYASRGRAWLPRTLFKPQPHIPPTPVGSRIGEDTMPALKDIVQSVKLDDGQSFVGLYDPTKTVDMNETEKWGTRYSFPMLAEDGRLVKIVGGTRLYEAILKAVGTTERPLKVRITAHGKRGEMGRDFDVQIVK